jgi:hypothetical protein
MSFDDAKLVKIIHFKHFYLFFFIIKAAEASFVSKKG